MASWNTELAKRDFQLGHIDSFQIERAVMTEGWTIRLVDGANFGPLTTARELSRPRVFKSLDAAVAALEEIGFSVEWLTNRG